jgi:hypothetical protein
VSGARYLKNGKRGLIHQDARHPGTTTPAHEPSLIAGPPGSVVLALDGRNAYRVMPNGEHRKLGAEEAADFHERFRAMEAGA